MKKEETLQTVAFLDSLAHTLLNLFFVHGAVLMVATGPVVTRPRVVTNALSRLKDVLQLAIEYLVINHSTLHIDNNGSCLQIIYL